MRFFGQVNKSMGPNGKPKFSWTGGEIVQAVAYDVPIPGYGTKSTINIRLWGAKPRRNSVPFLRLLSNHYG